MGYREPTFREIFKTNGMLKDLMGVGRGKSYLARVAARMSGGKYSDFVDNPFMMVFVFEEELRKVNGDTPKNLKEWIKRSLYINMVKNARKLAQEIRRKELAKY